MVLCFSACPAEVHDDEFIDIAKDMDNVPNGKVSCKTGYVMIGSDTAICATSADGWGRLISAVCGTFINFWQFLDRELGSYQASRSGTTTTTERSSSTIDVLVDTGRLIILIMFISTSILPAYRLGALRMFLKYTWIEWNGSEFGPNLTTSTR